MNKRIEYFLVFILVSIYYIPVFFSVCTTFAKIGFDNQALLTWEYTASRGILPYRDIFYPYGILFYFRNQNIFLHSIYFLLVPLIFLGLYSLFRRITRNFYLSFLSLILLFIFSERFLEYETFLRYGVFLLASILFPYLLYREKQKSINHLILGVITGISISLLLDQGFYLIMLYLFLSLPLFFKKNNRVKVLVNVLVFCFGIGVSCIPFVIYLLKTSSLISFLNIFPQLSYLTLIAKTPFTPFASSIENIFTFSITVCSVFLVSYKVLIKKQMNVFTYIQVGLLISILILEQKSFIRSIDHLLIVFGFVLLQIHLLEYSNYFKKKFFIYYSLLLLTIIFLIGLHPKIGQGVSKPYPFTTILSQLSSKNTLCIDQNKKTILEQSLSLRQIVNEIKPEKNIFVYSSYPAVYLLTSSKVPFYFNSYDASSLYAQKKQIEYLEINKIKYVVYDFKDYITQDGVPDYIRNSLLHSYLLKNYSLKKTYGQFFLLEKGNRDVFTDINKNQIPFLYNIPLESIPKFEGFYKEKYLREPYSTKLVQGENSEINTYLKKHDTSTKNVLLSIKPKAEVNALRITTSDQLTSNISLSSCSSKNTCIINISNLPIASKERIIQSINMNSAVLGLFINKSDKFW